MANITEAVITKLEELNMVRDKIDHEIFLERCAQDAKWGEQNHDPFKYASILGEEVGEVHRAILEAYDFKNKIWANPDCPTQSAEIRHLREELIQVAAVAKAFVECLDRGKWHV